MYMAQDTKQVENVHGPGHILQYPVDSVKLFLNLYCYQISKKDKN